MDTTLPLPARQRRCPSQFSWVDQRLARQRYFERASTTAWTLYLFLLTVADPQGVSYYSERSLCLRLRMAPEQLARARRELIDLDLLAYRVPIYQVLALNEPVSPSRTAPEQVHQHLKAMRRALK
jgi:hypothetical protein